MQKLIHVATGKRIAKFPFTLDNGMRVLRFERPSQAKPARLILNNGHENLVALPSIYGLRVEHAEV